MEWAGGATFALPIGDDAPSDSKVLDAEDVPVVELWSANASHPEGHDNGPFEHYDWRLHDTLFKKWAFVASASAEAA